MLENILAEVLGIPAAAVRDDLAMSETDSWDSLAHMQLIAAIESEFQLELTGDEIVAMTSVQGIRTVLAAHGALT